MPVYFILSAVLKEGNMCIGNKNDLLYKIPNDFKHFKTITKGNTVVMGNKTWESLPTKPLPGRKNIILSRTLKHNKNSPYIYMNFSQFAYYVTMNPDEQIYCIGGSCIFGLLMGGVRLRPEKIILTHIKPDKKTLSELEYDTIFDTNFFSNYRLYAYSGEENYMGLKYRFLFYRFSYKKTEEVKYLHTLQSLMDIKEQRPDRTGVGVYSSFVKQLKFDISNSIPMITTRNISFKNITEELLWICRGETDANILKSKGVNIWNGNTTREFLDSRNLKYREGITGPLYGFQLRHFGSKYPFKVSGFDQLEYVERLLKTDPFSRRIVINYLNPPDYDKAVLLPCHNYIQFYVEEKAGVKYLSCFFNMRSSDFALASCYNIVSYSILTYILALKCDMKPKDIVYNAVDCHIYSNHIEGIREQLKRYPRPFPSLHVNEDIKYKTWESIRYSDLQLVGYFPQKSIKFDMAV